MSARLQPALDVARNREQDAAQGMAAQQRRLTALEQRLQQLQTYRREYANQLQDAGRGGLSPLQFQHYIAFINSLDHSIQNSRQQLESLRDQCREKREQWLQTRAKTRALETVVERRQAQQRQAEARREQAQADDLGPRRHGRRGDG